MGERKQSPRSTALKHLHCGENFWSGVHHWLERVFYNLGKNYNEITYPFPIVLPLPIWTSTDVYLVLDQKTPQPSKYIFYTCRQKSSICILKE